MQCSSCNYNNYVQVTRNFKGLGKFFVDWGGGAANFWKVYTEKWGKVG
jgi:hypothetical protein